MRLRGRDRVGESDSAALRGQKPENGSVPITTMRQDEQDRQQEAASERGIDHQGSAMPVKRSDMRRWMGRGRLDGPGRWNRSG